MYTVFSLTLRQLTGSRRQAILWLFAALPAAFALLLRYLTDDYSAQIINLFDLLLVAIVLPLIVAILATTALGEEVEDRTPCIHRSAARSKVADYPCQIWCRRHPGRSAATDIWRGNRRHSVYWRCVRRISLRL